MLKMISSNIKTQSCNELRLFKYFCDFCETSIRNSQNSTKVCTYFISSRNFNYIVIKNVW